MASVFMICPDVMINTWQLITYIGARSYNRCHQYLTLVPMFLNTVKNDTGQVQQIKF